MIRKVQLFLALIYILSTYSCATLIYGLHQKVKIDSEPSGAKVLVNNKDVKKTTPCEIYIVRKQPRGSGLKRQVTFTLQKDNFNHVEIKDIARKNFLVGFFSWYPLVIPGMVDMIAGTNNIYTRKHTAQLSPAEYHTTKTDTVVRTEIVYVESHPKNKEYSFERKSDINKDIPSRAIEKPRRFALIIGNEDYNSYQTNLSNEINVHFARNDASAFKDYAIKVLGIPERNITFLLDATTGQMNQAVARINAIAKSTYGEAEIFIYYAGHGLPEETTREPYLIPVDVSGADAKNGISLKDFYAKLTEHPSKRVTVFIDACFSGGAREQGLIAARGVRVRPRENLLTGNLVIFSASSGEQSALPYKKKYHGFFTYYLLKLLKERGPNVTYGEIVDYLKKNVEVESLLVNDKEQTPQVYTSPTISNDWKEWSFK
ncbi:MAG: caspase domain-containing protein [Bacteroidales bacterium]